MKPQSHASIPGRVMMGCCWILVGWMAVLGLRGSWQAVAWDRAWTTPDPIAAQEQRLGQLRSFLPKQGRVGYLTDRPIDRDPEAEKRFNVSRYVLAPLLVVKHGDEPLVIVDGPPSAGLWQRLDPQRFELVAKPQTDLALMRKKGP